MNEKVFEKVTQYIDALAAKLGVAAEHVYGVLVRQQVAEGIVDIVVGTLVLTLLAVVLMILYKKYGLPTVEDETDFMFLLLAAAIPVGLIILAGSYGIEELSTGIKQVINPEYYAIREILDAIK